MSEPVAEAESAVEEAIGRAAEDVPSPASTEEAGPDGSPGPGPSPGGEPTGEDAIAAVEMGYMAVVVAITKLRRMELVPEIVELSRLTEKEKETLRPYAPYAAPYLQKFAMQSEKFMALMFLGIAGLNLTTRLKTIATIQQDQKAREKEEREIMKPEAWKQGESSHL
tara:strand:+ start:2961 stop:3461 length:501 start_codon:yes stop_codon:yes gene_type:complete